MSNDLSVKLWVITLVIAIRETVATSVGRKVTRHLSARRILLVSTVERQVI